MTSLFLESLSLRSFATFENQVIDFNSNFNGIVGETGSGKSLILDAFQLVLGARADKKLVRKGAAFATVEGKFKLKDEKFLSFFDELGFPIEEEYTVVIKRIIYATGKSKSFLNHLSCPLSVLSKFSKNFVDLVGQFENQKLTTPEYQMSLLDQFCENHLLLADYDVTYTSYKKNLTKIEQLTEALKDKGQREDYLRFQMRELELLDPSTEGEAKLLALKSQVLNKEESSKDLEQLKDLLSEGETNLLSLISAASKIIEKPAHFITDSSKENFLQLKSIAEDLSYDLSKISLEDDNGISIDNILEDLDRYQKLKRKFSVETDELQSLYNQFQEEIKALEDAEKKLEEALAEKDTVENRLYGLATKLHRKREKASHELSKLISIALKELNMEGATFKIDVTKLNSLGTSGLSLVNFEAETNKGEGFFKIKDIASGGELSRILLCLRQIVASEDTINIFFFDEIDTGIGGETAVKIAKALKKVSLGSQVLAITHLAQIAKEVDDIIFVEKKSLQVNDFIRTISCVSTKIGKEREEVINLLAGV